jgi:hypothetical protein
VKQHEVDSATFVEAEYLRLVANKSVGNATLVAGTIAVANTAVAANSYVLLSRKTIGGTAGNLSYTVSAGVGFTITSSSGTDTSVVTWVLVQPAVDDDSA